MNLGCGTLIALAVLVVLAGKLIPHGSTTVPPPHGAEVFKDQERVSGAGAARERAIKPSSNGGPSPQVPSLESVLSDVKLWIDEKAKEAEHNVLERAALPAGAGPAAEVLAKVGEDARALVTQGMANAVTMAAAPSPPLTVEKSPSTSLSMPAKPATRSGAPQSSGARLAVEGRDPVFNNPWNHAVEPVERYLKQHVHDAASIEMLEWGQVELTRDGYQVRCVYKSKNVLGKMATQSRLFVLNHLGQVVDIRD